LVAFVSVVPYAPPDALVLAEESVLIVSVAVELSLPVVPVVELSLPPVPALSQPVRTKAVAAATANSVFFIVFCPVFFVFLV
jgi:hypothetical protein